ncbi:MAG: potassium-transporting ATPase subunit KdpC [Polyangiales bacterium]
MSALRPALVLLALFTLLTGALYPALVTAGAQALFPSEANGSLIAADGQVRGSRLIGQSFTEPRYFWARPSATAPVPYNAAASSGSNQGPLHPALRDAVAQRISTLRAADPASAGPVPVDLVTASGSGLDPHVSPAAALHQVDRVARARSVPAARVRALVAEHVEPRTFGLLGEARVNVLALNLALDALTRGVAGRP